MSRAPRNQAVIDLTGPDSPARPNRPAPQPAMTNEREVIDIVDVDDDDIGEPPLPAANRAESGNDIQHLYTRPRYPPGGADAFAPHRPTTRRAARDEHHWAPAMGTGPTLPGIRDLMAGVQRDAERRRLPHNFMDIFAQVGRRGGGSTGNAPMPQSLGFALPEDMDYQTPAFQMGRLTPTRPPPPVRYSPPPPAQPGFTRNPGDDDVLVCPNCERELGAGEEVLHRQVWVIRSCGHVYCGECTKNRQKKPASKTPRPSACKPFSKCVVDGCGKSKLGSTKAMFQVYT